MVDFNSISQAVGVPPDILKLLGLLLISTPLSIPIPSLKSRSIHIYSILCSSIFLLYVFELYSGWIQLVVSSSLTWLILKTQLQSKNGVKSSTPWFIFFALLGHLTLNHARRLFWDISPDSVEITGSQMVLVMKLSTFAWNVYDGQQPAEKLDPYQRATSIKTLPGLLEFFSYCFFFPSLLVGPAITFSDYSKFTRGRDAGLPLPPNRVSHAVRKIFIGLLFAAIVGHFGGQWSYDSVLEDDFLRKNWLKRLWHLQVSGFMARGKYYLVWSLAEAALAMSGCGYNASKGDWSGGRNIDIKAIELAQNYKAVFDNWNMRTNIWLRECVYKRVAPMEGNKPGFKSTMATFLASAGWHGPLPAYFLAFLSAGLLQALGRSIRGSIRPFFLTSHPMYKAAYDVLCLIGTQITLNYLVVPFVLLDVHKTRVVYNRLGWYGHILAGSAMVVLWGAGLERKLRKFHASHSTHDKNTSARLMRNSNSTPIADPALLTGKQIQTVVQSGGKDGSKFISVTTVIESKSKTS